MFILLHVHTFYSIRLVGKFLFFCRFSFFLHCFFCAYDNLLTIFMTAFVRTFCEYMYMIAAYSVVIFQFYDSFTSANFRLFVFSVMLAAVSRSPSPSLRSNRNRRVTLPSKHLYKVEEEGEEEE